MSNDRKNTPDLLGGTGLLDQFLSGEKPKPAPPTLPSSDSTSADERLKSVKTEKLNDSITEKPAPEVEKKVRVNFYFPRELTEKIDLAVAQVRIHTRDAGYKASKSEFIEAALLYAIDEFERYGRDSQVTKITEKLISRKTG